MARHDLRQEDGRSRVHSEVSVHSGEPPVSIPCSLSVLSVCVLLLPLVLLCVPSVLSEHVSIKYGFSYQFQCTLASVYL